MKHYIDLGSTIRACSASETLARLEPQLKKFGITRVANVTGLDTIGIPVALSIRPNAKHLSVSQGKGTTWELAKVSAIMESIEGYHAENPPIPALVGTFFELDKKKKMVDPFIFHSGFLSPKALHSESLAWVEATELKSGSNCYIPHTLISLDSSRCQPHYSFFSVTSNGLASGNNLEEATCHALYEVIERDALSRWYQTPLEKRALNQIDLSTINSRSSCVNQLLIEKIVAAGLQIKIWDVTSSLNIPTYYCEICELDDSRALGGFMGSGTHLSKEVALARAITEAAQVRLTLISGSRDDVFPAYYRSRRECRKKSRMAQAHSNSSDQTQSSESMIDSNLVGSMDFNTRPTLKNSSSFKEDIELVLQMFQKEGFDQVYVMDHKKGKSCSLGISVVHVFVPGLQYE